MLPLVLIAVTFEPIHRVLFDTAVNGFYEYIKTTLSPNGDKEFKLRLCCEGEKKELTVMDSSIGTLIGRCEGACKDFISAKGGSIGYVHNDDYAYEMGSRTNCCALLLPPMDKGELFSSVQKTGPFPKKSFSIGLAQDKRYYLECRKITK